MKRRDFMRTTVAAGASVLAGAGCSSMYKTRATPYPQSNHDLLHPFIREHPEAVFIKLTDVASKSEEQAIHDAGFHLAKELFVQSPRGPRTRIACKPNWTCNTLQDGKSVFEQRGINTDSFFVEGFLKGVRDATGPKEIYLHECACPADWPAHGWPQMAERNGFILRDLTSRDFWEYRDGDDLKFVNIPNGTVSKSIAMQVPMTEPDTYIVNLAKLKAHGMGITAAIKNLQGISGRQFHQMCGGISNIFNRLDKRYHPYFHKNYPQRISELHKKHVQDGIPRWDRPGEKGNTYGGEYMEQWVQRMLDSLSVTPNGLSLVEGIYGRDGNGFVLGPHDGKAMDFMCNQIIFGLDPFRVDIISHWLAGHEPGNFGLFHIGIERGMSNVLDPHDIPIYLWDEGKATLTRLDRFKRTPLVTYYLRRNYDGGDEPYYHMCDEPFDYSAWKARKTQAARPDVRGVGKDASGNVVMEVSLPEKDDVYVDVLNRHGEIVWSLRADGLEPGVHQVVWDGFCQPGLYNAYVKGMGWDAARQMVVYS